MARPSLTPRTSDRRCSDSFWSSRSPRGRSQLRSSSIDRSASRAFPSATRCRDPYLVCFDGAIAVGLHDRAKRGPRLTFVRPGLRDYVRALRRPGVELDARSTCATTSSTRSASPTPAAKRSRCSRRARSRPATGIATTWPSAASSSSTRCRPTRLDVSSRFWEPLGLAAVAAGEAPHRWQRLAGRGLTLGLHETHCVPGLELSLRRLAGAARVSAREGIVRRATGTPIARSRAGVGDARRSPRATHLYLLEKRRAVSAATTSEPARRIDLGERIAQPRMQRARAREVREQYSIWSASTRRPFR